MLTVELMFSLYSDVTTEAKSKPLYLMHLKSLMISIYKLASLLRLLDLNWVLVCEFGGTGYVIGLSATAVNPQDFN